MKTLQNNFTTQEQSERLLELGVPVNSADCYYCIINATIQQGIEVICDSDTFFDINTYLKDFFPCWSVGRLREIFCICSSVNGTRKYPFCNDQVAWWITEFEFKKEFIDFSKLEE